MSIEPPIVQLALDYPTIDEALAMAEIGVRAGIDILEAGTPLIVCAEWGVDMIYLHYGADQRRADGSRDSTQWLVEVLDAVDVPVGVGTFGVEDAVRAAENGADLVCIGHPLIDHNPLAALTDYVNQVKSKYRPRA
jgi:3-keto-L-gulonate-6-phosphate decarboxylase